MVFQEAQGTSDEPSVGEHVHLGDVPLGDRFRFVTGVRQYRKVGMTRTHCSEIIEYEQIDGVGRGARYNNNYATHWVVYLGE